MAKTLKEFKEKLAEVAGTRKETMKEVVAEKKAQGFDPDLPENKQRWLR